MTNALEPKKEHQGEKLTFDEISGELTWVPIENRSETKIPMEYFKTEGFF